MTRMLTWQADGAPGIEGVRLLLNGGGLRALGRMVRADLGEADDDGMTVSYRLVVGEDGRLSRLSLTSATAQRERHLTMNRTEDGFWLLDDGAGATRNDFGGAADVDVAHSPMFNTLPIRRLGLHREVGEHVVPMLFVSVPDLRVELTEQHYRTLSLPDGPDGHGVVEFRAGDVRAEIVIDADGLVVDYPTVARRLTAGVTRAAS